MKIIFSFIIFLSFSVYYCQNVPEIFEEDSKFGIKYQGKMILPAVYDRITTYPLIIATKGKERTIYDYKMAVLFNNADIIRYVFLDDSEMLQILTRDHKLFSYDEDGLITDPLQLDPNETISNKSSHFENRIDEYLIKGKNIQAVNDAGYRYYNYDYKKYGKKAKFLNNKEKMEIENLYKRGGQGSRDTLLHIVFTEEVYFEPLKVNYIVSKVKGKYGVWDFINEKIVLPYDYQKITPFHNYLLIKRKNLFTFYPNIGTEPKYKKLEPYIGYFARFETVDGKKGWVDRKGKEYFDE